MGKSIIKLWGEKNNSQGQSLIEILIGLGIGVALILGASTLIAVNLKGSSVSKMTQTSALLTDEIVASARSISESDWHKIYCPPNGICPGAGKGDGVNYYIDYTGPSPQIISGNETVIVEGKEFIRYFNINNVNRDQCGMGAFTQNSETACASGPGSTGISEDPSTQKITVVVLYGNNELIKQDHYLVRSKNSFFKQTDWKGGSGQEGPITSVNNRYASSTGISTSTPGVIKIKLP